MSSSLPELSNRIISVGTLVLFGMLPAKAAFERIRQDQELANLPDDQLQSLIEETDRYWRESMAVSSPESYVIYPELMVTCIKVRLKSLGQFAAGASDEEKPEVNLRRAHWITILAQSLLAEGMVFLLVPEPQMAWRLFAEANVGARALPDFGQLRLREVMWACYGQSIAAQLGRQQGLILQAEEELARLLQIPNREQEALTYLEEIRQEFATFRNVFQQRQKELAPSHNPTSTTPENYTVFYNRQLNHYADLILSGKMEPGEAKKEFLASIDFSQVERSIYFVSMFNFGAAQTAPDRAIVLADLNYAAACLLTGDLAALTRAYCAHALGSACVMRARQNHNDAETFRQAIPYLEEALPVIEKSTGSTSDYVQHIMIQLSLCYRGVGDFEKASELNSRLIERLAEQSDFYARLNLGVAYGNRADVQAQMGNLDAAFENHYRAFQLFLEVKNLQRMRQALDYMADVGLRIGRLDDTIAAWQETADLMVELADLKGAVEIYVLLARYAFRLGHEGRGLRLLQRAEDLILPQVSKEHLDQEVLLLYHELLIWQGYVFTLLLVSAPPGEYTFEQAYEPLERSRQIAVELQDHNRVAQSILQLANLFDAVGKFDGAEMYCDMIDFVPCSPVNIMTRDGILGRVRVHQGRYKEAIVYLQKVIAAYTTDTIYGLHNRDNKWVALHLIGQAYEGIGDFEEAAQSYESALDIIEQSRLEFYEESRMGFVGKVVEVYDRLITLYAKRNTNVYNPVRALFWLEKSKSRTFVEIMGLSNIPLRDAPADIRAVLTEEGQLLRELNTIRGELFISSKAQIDRLDLQQKMYTDLGKLKSIWDRLAARYPEYVEMRQGRVVDWSEVQKMFEEEL